MTGELVKGALETRTNNQIKDKQIVTTVSKETDGPYFIDEKTKRTIQFIVTAQCGAISVYAEKDQMVKWILDYKLHLLLSYCCSFSGDQSH